MYNDRHGLANCWFPADHPVNLPRATKLADVPEKYDEKSLLPSAAQKYRGLKKSPGRTPHEKQFLLKALCKLPQPSVDVMLDAMPSSENRPVLELDIPMGAENETIHSILGSFADLRLDGLKEKCLEDCQKTILASQRLREVMNVVREQDLAHINGEIVEYLGTVSEEARRSELEMMESVADFAALQCIKHARVFGGHVTFPQDVDKIPGFSKTFVDSLKARKLFSRMVSDSIRKVFADDIEFVFHDYFAPVGTKLHDPNVPFLLVSVEHTPMNDPEFHLTSYFLSPGDQIAHVPLEVSARLEKTSTISILVRLASKNLPPRFAIAGRRRDYLEYVLQRTFNGKFIRHLKTLVAYYERRLDDSPEMEVLVLKYRAQLQSTQKSARYMISKIEEYAQKPYSMRLRGEGDAMKTEIIYPQGLCIICNTSEHLFIECSKRGCTICYNRNHAASRCPFKCGCKIGDTHAFEGCDFAKPLKEVNGRRLLETRRRNDPKQKTLIY